MEKKIIITTSWDDGHELDIKLAELLAKYGVEGTFYVPLKNAEHQVMSSALLTEIASSFEIGGHTVNHIYLNTLGKQDAKYEISECKNMLQQQIGKEVKAFCYPGGKYSKRDIELVEEAGFLFGRTTRLLHTDTDTDQQLMNTSMQAFNHSGAVLTKHCIKHRFIQPIVQYGFFHKANKNFIELSEIILNGMQHTGGVFHLWGHSWELEKFQLWEQLEFLLNKLSTLENVTFLNNTDCWKSVQNSRT